MSWDWNAGPPPRQWTPTLGKRTIVVIVVAALLAVSAVVAVVALWPGQRRVLAEAALVSSLTVTSPAPFDLEVGTPVTVSQDVLEDNSVAHVFPNGTRIGVGHCDGGPYVTVKLTTELVRGRVYLDPRWFRLRMTDGTETGVLEGCEDKTLDMAFPVTGEPDRLVLAPRPDQPLASWKVS